jgi:hypothetical protein
VPDQARTFISYSRKDGIKFAAELRNQLILSVWQDIIALEGGRDWWSQIEEALRSKTLQHFVLVVTPAALASPVVRREIRLARQEGKTVCPVKGPGLADLGKLPRWLGHIYDLDLMEQRTALIRVLQDQSRQKRVAMMAPEPPADFAQRPAEFDALKQKLLDPKGDAVAITAALRGAGGYGKTTLAKALAHDPDVQDAYFDGILWVELGEKPQNLLSIISDLVEILSGERPGLENINAAAAKLGEALDDRRILMIVDDAWREQDLRPFMQGGTNTTRLVTTRNDNILPSNAVRQRVDAMRGDEALTLWDLARGAETARLDGHSSWVTALCGLPDGRLASGSGDNTIRLWDLTHGAETARLDGHSDAVAALCVLPDGRLASGSHDNTIRLWDLARGAETARLDGHSRGVTALCGMPDGRLASGSGDNTIRLWDLTARTEVSRLEVDAPIHCLGHPQQ